MVLRALIISVERLGLNAFVKKMERSAPAESENNESMKKDIRQNVVVRNFIIVLLSIF